METAKRILTKENLDRQLAGESTGTPSLLTMREDRKQWQRTVMFDESNVMDAKIDKLASVLGIAIYSEQAVQAI